MNRSARRRPSVVVLVAAVCLVASAERVVTAAQGPADGHALIDVPYVSQTPELCGGAAVAMVMRYWGERDVVAQEFAPLVSADRGGILTGRLATAVRDRGWQAVVASLTEAPARARIRSDVGLGRPVIALIEVGPSTYHYVVVVGITDNEVVLHDPARAPFRVVPWAEFDRAWVAAGRWVMVVLPPVDRRPVDAAATPDLSPSGDPDTTSPCAALVARGVDRALAGDREQAERGLVAATVFCPNDPASWRELAGWRFSQSRWADAQVLAMSAIRLSPDDTYSWQLIATSRYLMGETRGALDAWSRAGGLRIDTLDVHGAERTPHPVVVRATRLAPRQVLTSAAFGRASRRLRDLPVAASAGMRYEPIGEGLARLNLSIAERSVVPRGWVQFASLGARAALLREVRVEGAGPLGAGERVSAEWRWATGRPRFALELALPAPHWLPGVVSIDGSWERQSYGVATSADDTGREREERRRFGLQLADWASRWLRWQIGVALDRLSAPGDRTESRSDAPDRLAADAALDVRLAGDRAAIKVSGGWWTAHAGEGRIATGGVKAAWRSTTDATRRGWSAEAAAAMASRSAPRALWPGAGTGQGRDGLIRAHPLVEDGLLTGPVFGRDVTRGSLEYVQPVTHLRVPAVSMAGFLDAARAWHRPQGPGPSPVYLDAGVGLRVHVPGSSHAFRIDLAHGLGGGGLTLSAGWGGAWPN